MNILLKNVQNTTSPLQWCLLKCIFVHLYIFVFKIIALFIPMPRKKLTTPVYVSFLIFNVAFWQQDGHLDLQLFFLYFANLKWEETVSVWQQNPNDGYWMFQLTLTFYLLKIQCEMCNTVSSQPASTLERKACHWNIYLRLEHISLLSSCFIRRWSSLINFLFHSMEITGMLYILPRVVFQDKAYLNYETQ